MDDRQGGGRADPVAAIYHRALPHVYGYLLPRCGNASLAEDLAAETFLAAVATARQQVAVDMRQRPMVDGRHRVRAPAALPIVHAL